MVITKELLEAIDLRSIDKKVIYIQHIYIYIYIYIYIKQKKDIYTDYTSIIIYSIFNNNIFNIKS